MSDTDAPAYCGSTRARPRPAIPSVCDVLVVGAGVAGATAARLLAEQGYSVVLVDRAPFPRQKVCGGCLNGRALAWLRPAGLDLQLQREGAVPLRQSIMAAGGRAAPVPLPGGLAVTRGLLDQVLVRAGQQHGVLFLDGTLAELGSVDGGYRHVWLTRQHTRHHVSARVVLAADGIHGKLLERAGEGAPRITPGSRIGLGTIVTSACAAYVHGTVFLACAPRGYVGVARAEHNQLIIAAAMDPEFLRAHRSPAEAVREVLREALFATPDLEGACWKGTPPLTRHRTCLAAERVLVLGDSAGYVEPFTGEGMAWALSSAHAAAQCIRDVGLDAPVLGNVWNASRQRAMRRQRFLCQATARLLRSPRTTRALAVLLSRNPSLLRPLVGVVNAEHRS